MFTLSGDSEFKVTLDYIRQRVNAYIEVDDIFHNAFLAAVVFQAPEADAFSTTDDALEYLQGPGTNCIINARSADLLPRPYALIGNQLRDVWKLIDDINGTCMVTLKPQSRYTKTWFCETRLLTHDRASDAFETFPIKGTDDRFSSFTLQSRIKTQAKSEAALADMRILVKDNIHLKGVETSVGNKAFYDTCPKQE